MRIVLVGSKHADRRNMEHLVYRIGEIMDRRHTVSIVGPSRVSERIERKFEWFSWEKIQHDGLLFNLCVDPISTRIVRLVKHAKSWRPDVLVALGSIGVNGLAVSIAGKLTGIPSVVRLTSDVFKVYSSKPKLRQKLRMFIRNNILGYIALKTADRVLLLHESQRSQIVSLGIPPNRLLVAPQPIVFPEHQSDDLQEIRKELGIAKEALVVLSTMRLDPDKRTDLMAKVVNHVLSMDVQRPVHFVIIGDGECRVKLQERTALYHSRVHFLKELPRDKLASYYRTANLYLHLSKSEGLSNCIAEALYFGLPVIASDSGTITRSMVSNVVDDCRDICNMIINGDLKRDMIPAELLPDNNRMAWLKAVELEFGN